MDIKEHKALCKAIIRLTEIRSYGDPARDELQETCTSLGLDRLWYSKSCTPGAVKKLTDVPKVSAVPEVPKAPGTLEEMKTYPGPLSRIIRTKSEAPTTTGSPHIRRVIEEILEDDGAGLPGCPEVSVVEAALIYKTYWRDLIKKVPKLSKSYVEKLATSYGKTVPVILDGIAGKFGISAHELRVCILFDAYARDMTKDDVVLDALADPALPTEYEDEDEDDDDDEDSGEVVAAWGG